MPRDTLLIGSTLLFLAFGLWELLRPKEVLWGRHASPRDVALIQMRNYETAIESYDTVHRRLPDNLQALTQPSAKNPHPFLEEVRLDPWGNAYEYRVEGKKFTIRSRGEDGRPGTADDIVWPDPP